MALPSLLLLAVTLTGLVLSVVLVGLPLLLGGLVLVRAFARLDRWLVNRLTGAQIEEPGPLSAGKPWRRAGLVRVSRDTTFVVARTTVALVALVVVLGAVVAVVAGLGAVTVDGFLATGQWKSTAGPSSWWGVPLAVAAVVVAAAGLVVAGYLQATLAVLLGPTESSRLEQARHRQRLADERARLAADLHDAVGHSLTVTTLQAAAAATVVRTDPAFVEDALRHIEEESRRALTEVDRALALLTGGSEANAPGADQLPDLLTALRTAGLDVDADGVDVPEDLGDDLSQTVYRILQESGTNALRHGLQGKFIVSIYAAEHRVAIVVASPMPRDADQTPRIGPGGGRGLDGLRARCERLGGRLTAGPSDDGREWVVNATLPLDSKPER